MTDQLSGALLVDGSPQGTLASVVSDEQQFVACLEHIAGLRNYHSVGTNHGDQGGVGRQLQFAHRLPDQRIVFGQGEFRQCGVAFPQAHQSHQVTDVDGTLDSGNHRTRRRDRYVDPPGLAEQPLVADVVDPGHHPRHPELGLGQQTHHQVGFVVSGCGDHHVARLRARFLQRGHFAGVGVEPIRVRHLVRLEVRSLPLDQQDLVPGVEQLLCDRAADIAGAGNPDPQLSLGHLTIFTYARRRGTSRCAASGRRVWTDLLTARRNRRPRPYQPRQRSLC